MKRDSFNRDDENHERDGCLYSGVRDREHDRGTEGDNSRPHQQPFAGQTKSENVFGDFGHDRYTDYSTISSQEEQVLRIYN